MTTLLPSGEATMALMLPPAGVPDQGSKAPVEPLKAAILTRD